MRACRIIEIAPLSCTLTGCALPLASCLVYATTTIPDLDTETCPAATVNITIPPLSACADCTLTCVPPILRNECTDPEFGPLVCSDVCTEVQCLVPTSSSNEVSTWRTATISLASILGGGIVILVIMYVVIQLVRRYGSLNPNSILRARAYHKYEKAVYLQANDDT